MGPGGNVLVLLLYRVAGEFGWNEGVMYWFSYST